jgi:cytidyltransferase-like protein
VILCSGAFDGLHSGHVLYLEAADRLDPSLPLVVAVAPDSYSREHKARETRLTQHDRGLVIAALRHVSRVLLHEEPDVAAVIRAQRPKYFVKGVDWVGKLPEDVMAACLEVGAVMAFVRTNSIHCSTVWPKP